ncbi:hypothetical protein F5146DRAFT_603268 [Armillaria mellea]|nr:hypothetical protein F5146DRAFT_603268 [Armillaria mellea]
MYPSMRARILLLYPGAGLGGKKWRLTWEQVMSQPLPADDYCYGDVERDDETDEDWYEGCCIEQGLVQGLNAGSAEGVDRCGELVVKDPYGMQHTFKILTTHQFLIPEGPYTLLGVPWFSDLAVFWVVGRTLPDQRFEKLSVITIPDKGERKRLHQCGLAQREFKVYLC